MQIASEFPQGPVRDRYMAEAKVLRLPYWDFATPAAPGQDILPSVFTQNLVALQGPYGRVQIENPLYQFDFNGAPAPVWDNLIASVGLTLSCGSM